MSAEHKRPLVAFILVALVCSSIVGNSVRSALLGNGFGLSILVPMVPAHLLETIHASGANGRYEDAPFLGTAIGAVGDVTEPTAPLPGSTAPGAPVTPATEGAAAQVVRAVAARSVTTTAPRASGARAHAAKQPHRVVHPPRPRAIGEPPPVPTGPTTLQTARDDLRAARVYATDARHVAGQAARVAKFCVRTQGRASCDTELQAAEEAAIRADAAAAQAGDVQVVVQHLLGAIDAFVSPIREQATRTFAFRVDKAKAQLTDVREQVRSDVVDFRDEVQDQQSDVLAAYQKAIDRASTVSHRAADQRLREVRSYSTERQATVRSIQRVYEQKVRAGHIAAAREFRKQALADLAEQDAAFSAKISRMRDRAAAAYETAIGAAKQDLDRAMAAMAEAKAAHDAVVATTLDQATQTFTTKVQTADALRDEKIAQAQALAEATVVVDPATLPVGPIGRVGPAGAGR